MNYMQHSMLKRMQINSNIIHKHNVFFFDNSKKKLCNYIKQHLHIAAQ